MGTVRTIAKNSLFYFTGQVASCILSFFFFMQAARYFGAGNFGILSFALALAAIFGAFNDLGLRQITTREVAKDKSLAGKYLANITGMKIILTMVVSTGLVVTVNLLNYPQTTRYVVYFIGISIVFTAFIQMFYGLFQAHEKMEFESLGIVLRNSLLVVSATLVITMQASVLKLAMLYPVVDLLILIYAAGIYLWKFGKLRIEIDTSFLKQTLRHALPFGLTAIFGMTNHWLSTVMLSMMKGDVVVGWYSAAYRIVFVLLLIPVAFDAAVFPVMSRLFVSSHDSLKIMCEKGFKYLTFLGIPVGIGGTLLADKIILLIFGPDYSNSATAFKILIWAAVFIFMGTPFSSMLNSTNKQMTLAKLVGLASFCNVMGNLLLVPNFGYIGASISMVLSMFVIFAGTVIATSKTGCKIHILSIAGPVVTAFGSGLAMGLAIICFQNLSIFLLVFVAPIIYFAVIFATKGFDRADFNLFKKLAFRQ